VTGENVSNIESRFSDLAKKYPTSSGAVQAAKDYPGGKVPVNRAEKSESDYESASAWDSDPVQYPYKGGMRDFFTIGHLAKALGRSTVTIRAWESRGVLPTSDYRGPRPRTTPNFGSTPRGKRLWTREQVEGILRIAEEERVITDPHQKPPNTRFTTRVTELFLRLRAKEDAA
jgi:hypothetical protein